MRAVAVSSLSATYPGIEKPLLADISFVVEAGSAFGVVGPSGCGKSTLLRVLAGLHATWSGRVALLEKPIAPGRRFAPPLRRAVQMVFQDPYASLHPHHTVGRALLEPLKILGAEDPGSAMLEALERVGLPATIAARYPHELSGGERQRVAIGRALLPKPKILLLDEPTSALDLAAQAEILNLLSELQAAQSMTLILVSHDMGVVAHLCDLAVSLAEGRIARSLPRSALDLLP